MGILETTLARWRAHPTPERSALVVRAGRLAGMGRDAISGTDHAELQKAWLAVEKRDDPADLDRLLAALADGRCEGAIARLGKLEKRQRDPRIVERLVTFIEADPELHGAGSVRPFTSGPNRPFWNRLLELVEAFGDAGTSARLREVAKRPQNTNFQRWLAGKVEKIARTFDERGERPVTAGERLEDEAMAAELTKLELETRPVAQAADSLYAAVWAAPDDDSPRAVLADFLLERNDPRGEFIALQLARAAGTLDATGKAREKELLKRHKKQWLGPIAPLIQPYSQRFERGFLVTCQLEPNAELERTLGDHPAWATIREYLVHGYSTASGTHTKLVAMLQRHGAVQVVRKFTRGIE